MKTLLSTTALVLAIGFPTLGFAQTTAETATQTDTAQTETPGFLSVRGSSDLFASELIGHDVFARRVPTETAATGDAASMNSDASAGMGTIARADLDAMDNIGQINEIILSSDGQIRALVIGVGGFLAMGEQDVAVTMDQVTFVTDNDDQSQFYIIADTGADLLKTSPAFDRTAARPDDMHTDMDAGTMDAGTDRTALAAPEMMRDGYNQVEVTEVTTEMLMGRSVFSVNDNEVGTVTDMIIDDAGSITNVIIDFGGFLGMGVSHASLDFDELTILSTDGYDDVRLYVDATKEQIEALPQYEAVK